jgi:integrase
VCELNAFQHYDQRPNMDAERSHCPRSLSTLCVSIHRRGQLEQRVALGQGRPGPNALVFSTPEGTPLSPDNLSRDWRRVALAKGLPRVKFYALRHGHASALIGAGLDVLTVSRRLGARLADRDVDNLRPPVQ